MRILHFADVHLDRPFAGFAPEVAGRRRAGLFAAFQRCLALAREHDVGLITIGGDLWEEEHVRADTRNSVSYELGATGIPILIACGNHDPLIEGGSYLRTIWPENVSLVGRRSISEHPYGDVSIWSVSWGGSDLSARVLEHFEAPRDGRTHILLIHGTSLAAPFAEEADDSYLPFDPELVRRAGFDVCLAGHVHMASHVKNVVYPGSPEPLGWGERGRHCVALVDTGSGGLNVELLDVNEKRYETREVDCSGCSSSAEVEDRVETTLNDHDPHNVFLRLRLVGEIDPDAEIDRARIAAQHRTRYAAMLVENRTDPLLDIGRRGERKGLDGMFVRKLQARLDGAATQPSTG